VGLPEKEDLKNLKVSFLKGWEQKGVAGLAATPFVFRIKASSRRPQIRFGMRLF